jgi:hypothetical protein
LSKTVASEDGFRLDLLLAVAPGFEGILAEFDTERGGKSRGKQQPGISRVKGKG